MKIFTADHEGAVIHFDDDELSVVVFGLALAKKAAADNLPEFASRASEMVKQLAPGDVLRQLEALAGKAAR